MIIFTVQYLPENYLLIQEQSQVDWLPISKQNKNTVKLKISPYYYILHIIPEKVIVCKSNDYLY